MNYRISVKNWGRVFSVPCSVVDKYLKDTDGDSLKVLLCVVSLGEDEISSEKISTLCGVSESCVINALDYWTSCGIIKADCNDFVGFTPVIEKRKTIKESALLVEKSETVRSDNNYYTPAQIAEIISTSQELKDFFDEVQAVLGRILTNSDQRGFIHIYEEYGFSPASILLLTEYCKDIGKTTIAYIKSVAKSWFSQDIIAYDDVEKHIIELNEYHSYENGIARALGVTIKLTTRQREYIQSWRNMGISFELAEYAYERCADATSKLSFGYINIILENWHNQGITTVEQAKNESKTTKKSTAKEHSYDLNEIEEFQKNYLLNRKKLKK